MEMFEKEYKKHLSYWGGIPSSVVELHLSQFMGTTVLDVGAGDGRNALFLAKKGYKVTALDTAQSGLKNIEIKTKKAGLQNNITTINTDFIKYDSNDLFDNVITNFTIHFVGYKNITKFLDKLVAYTKPGGINLIDDFTQNGSLAIKKSNNFITKDMLINYYSQKGWSIIYVKTRKVKVKYFELAGKPSEHEAIGFVAKNQ